MKPQCVAVLVLALATGGCATTTEPERAGRVQLESRGNVSARPSSQPGPRMLVHPPLFDRPVLPDYPAAAVEAGITDVRVTVRFTVGTDGLPRDVRPTVEGGGMHAEAFASAAEQAILRWRFSPAWRLAGQLDDAGGPLVLLEHGGQAVFLFDLALVGPDGKAQLVTAP